jgi:hypothetical protein
MLAGARGPERLSGMLAAGRADADRIDAWIVQDVVHTSARDPESCLVFSEPGGIVMTDRNELGTGGSVLGYRPAVKLGGHASPKNRQANGLCRHRSTL